MIRTLQMLMIICLMMTALASGQNGNSALYLDGKDGVMDVQIERRDVRRDNFTISFWAKPTSDIVFYEDLGQQERHSSPQTLLFTSGNAGVSSGVSIAMGTNGVICYENSFGRRQLMVSSQQVMPDWTHVVLVYTKKQPTLYVDGSFVQRGATTHMSSVGYLPARLGWQANGEWKAFAGMIDDFAVWTRPLTIDEIESVHGGEILANDSGLAVFFDFDEMNRDATVPDKSGSGHLGMLVNGAAIRDRASSQVTASTPIGKIDVPTKIEVKEIGVLAGHSGSWGVGAITFSHDSRLLLTGGSDKKIIVWDVEKQEQLAKFKYGEMVNRVAFSPNDSLVAGLGLPGKLKVWSITTGKRVLEFGDELNLLSAFEFHPDGKTIALGHSGGSLSINDAFNGEELFELAGHEKWTKPLAFGPDGKLLASSGMDLTIRLWDMTQQSELASWNGHQDLVSDLAFSPDGSLLASLGGDDKIKIWDVDRLGEDAAYVFPHKSATRIAFHPSGSYLASSGIDKSVRIWRLGQMDPVVVLEGQGGVAFSSNGKLLASGDSDNRVRLWDVSMLPEPMTLAGSERQPSAPSLPPQLTAEIRFREPSGNRVLDAGESGALVLTVRNVGQGMAFNITPSIVPDSAYPYLDVSHPEPIASLSPGDSVQVEYALRAGYDLSTMQTAFTVLASEANGFDLDPSLRIGISTQEFIPPRLSIGDYAIADFSGNRKIERSELVEITVRIQNSGEGPAYGTTAEIVVGENVFVAGDSRTKFEVGKLDAGQYEDIVFSVYTNNKATGMPVTVRLDESHGKYGHEQLLDLPFEVVQKAPRELMVEGTLAERRQPADIPSLVADVDREIPRSSLSRPDAVAVVIGNRDYTCGEIPAVDFAINDAAVVRTYLTDLLGYQEGNIIYLENANQSQLRSVFGTEKFVGRLANMVKDSLSDVFIYYSGHGAPDPNSKKGYFLPVDCCPNDVRLNGYPLETFYRNIGSINARSITVIIDACFSGGSNEGMLIQHASPVALEIENPVSDLDRATVFASSSASQISSWYPEKQHGLFTYFLLKGLRGHADTDENGELTAGELFAYISDPTRGVPYYARSIYNGRVQTPVIMGDQDRSLVEYDN